MAREPGKRDSCDDKATRIVAVTGITLALVARLGFHANRIRVRAARR